MYIRVPGDDPGDHADIYDQPMPFEDDKDGPCDDGYPHRIVEGFDYDWCSECERIWT